MIHITETERVNNDQTVKTEVGDFYVCQRNEGFATNDGRWVVELMPELYWSKIGTLRQRHSGAFVGVFSTPVDMVEAIASAPVPPAEDKMVR